MKKLLLLTILPFVSIITFAQKDTTLKFPLKYWSLEAGGFANIPLREYNEKYGYDCFDCQSGEFNVNPQFTIGNYLIRINHRGLLKQVKQNYLGTSNGFGYAHQQLKNKKVGNYHGGEFPVNFKGTISNQLNVDLLFLENAINYNIFLNKRTVLVNQIGLLSIVSFYETYRSVEEGNITNTMDESYFGLGTLTIAVNYEIGTMFQISKKFIINPKFNLPLYSIHRGFSNGLNEINPYTIFTDKNFTKAQFFINLVYRLN